MEHLRDICFGAFGWEDEEAVVKGKSCASVIPRPTPTSAGILVS